MDRLELDSRDLQRIELDPSMFRIPAGYAIKDSVPLHNNPGSTAAPPDSSNIATPHSGASACTDTWRSFVRVTDLSSK
jgi:hypothetical protein